MISTVIALPYELARLPLAVLDTSLSGLPETSMRPAKSGTAWSRGSTERIASMASAAVRLSIRSRRPVTVARWRRPSVPLPAPLTS